MTFRHRAGVSPYTSHRWFARTCVFGKQSLGPFLCSSGASPGAILLPKLRMYFAEFLYVSSLVRLRILSSPTCVGLWYGSPLPCLRDYFPALRLRALPPHVWGLAHGSARPADLPPGLFASPLRRGLPSPRRVSPCASSLRNSGKRRNVDLLPVGYGLRPRLRGRLTLGQIDFTLETSGFRRRGIPPLFPLLMPAFSLPVRPAGLPPDLLPYPERSPTHCTHVQCRSFGAALSPVELSAPDYSTSELLRTL